MTSDSEFGMQLNTQNNNNNNNNNNNFIASQTHDQGKK